MQLVNHYLESPQLMVRPAHEIVRIARILLSDINLWTQSANARDEYGKRVKPNHPSAVCWSMSGAIAIASNPYGITPPSLLKLLDGIVREWGLVQLLAQTPDFELWENSDDFNDKRPHPFILALLDEATIRLENR